MISRYNLVVESVGTFSNIFWDIHFYSWMDTELTRHTYLLLFRSNVAFRWFSKNSDGICWHSWWWHTHGSCEKSAESSWKNLKQQKYSRRGDRKEVSWQTLHSLWLPSMFQKLIPVPVIFSDLIAIIVKIRAAYDYITSEGTRATLEPSSYTRHRWPQYLSHPNYRNDFRPAQGYTTVTTSTVPWEQSRPSFGIETKRCPWGTCF